MRVEPILLRTPHNVELTALTTVAMRGCEANYTWKYELKLDGHLRVASAFNLFHIGSFMEYDTQYFYELGTHDVTRRFSITTPPKAGPGVTYTFGVMGQYYPQ